MLRPRYLAPLNYISLHPHLTRLDVNSDSAGGILVSLMSDSVPQLLEAAHPARKPAFPSFCCLHPKIFIILTFQRFNLVSQAGFPQSTFHMENKDTNYNTAAGHILFTNVHCISLLLAFEEGAETSAWLVSHIVTVRWISCRET